MIHDPEPGSEFLHFSDLLTGYRISAVLMTAHAAGVFASLADGPVPGDTLCARAGWDPEYGRRFLACLRGLGLLREVSGNFAPTAFAETYLCPQAQRSQGQTLAFEQQMAQSWQQLDATLKAGQRVFETGDKSAEQLRQARERYMGAMDEAARIRAAEVWDCFAALPPRGTILDLGAGSGVYLLEFLQRFPAWSAIFCDLSETVACARDHGLFAQWAANLTWRGCNLLSEEPSEFDAVGAESCDLTLLSNLIHCQGPTETDRLLRRAAAKTAAQGMIVVHDFFADCGWRGALYDLHMMLNTYNGRTYALREIVDMAARQGFRRHAARALASGSTLLVLTREENMDGAGWERG
jgi:SAM-dependent methyltransferase